MSRTNPSSSSAQWFRPSSVVLVGALLVLVSGCVHKQIAFDSAIEDIESRCRHVAVVTCVEATSTEYMTYCDEFLSGGYRVRWTLEFHTDQMIQGNLKEGRTLRLVNAKPETDNFGDRSFSGSGIRFEGGRQYVIGFNVVVGERLQRIRVLNKIHR